MPRPGKRCTTAAAIMVLLFACNDDQQTNESPILDNKERIECEKRSPLCNAKDAMRFYKSVPVIQLAADSSTSVTEVWSSFLVCCDVFQQLMDSLVLYNDLLIQASKEGTTFTRSGFVDSTLSVSAGVEYFDRLQGKKWEWLNFGDGKFTWSLPVGEYFKPYKEQLEEAHARCCLL
jgi:hypothetical protein